MAQQRRGGRRRRKVDFIAANHIEYIDYKDTDLFRKNKNNKEAEVYSASLLF